VGADGQEYPGMRTNTQEKSGTGGGVNQAQKDTRYYIEALRSEECFCERPKKSGYSFCYRCYKALPRDMQRDLWQRMGDGYEAAFDAAVVYLQQEVL